MTRTARATYPRAVMKDRSESRSGLDSSLRKGGAGGHNWGSLTDERQLETAGFEDENAELEEVGRQKDVAEDMSSKATPSSPPANLSEDELKQARSYRKNVLNKKNVDLSAIARTSAAASTSPPNPSGFTKRLANNEKQAPPSTTTNLN